MFVKMFKFLVFILVFNFSSIVVADTIEYIEFDETFTEFNISTHTDGTFAKVGMVSFLPKETMDEVFADYLPSPLTLADKLDNFIYVISKANGLDPKLVKKIIWVESRWNPNAVSYADAIGLMQVRQIAAEDVLGYRPTVEELKDPFFNVSIGIRYFKKMLDYSDGNVTVALIRYNMGPGATNRLLRRNPNYDPHSYFYTKLIAEAKTTERVILKI